MKVEVKRSVKQNFKISKKIEQSIIYFANNDISKIYKIFDNATNENKLDIIHIVETMEQKMHLIARSDDYVKKNTLQYLLSNSAYLKQVLLSYENEDLKVDGLIYFAKRLKEEEKLEIIKSLENDEDILNCQGLVSKIDNKIELYDEIKQTYIKNRFIKNVKNDEFSAAVLFKARRGKLLAEDFALIESDDIKLELALYTEDDTIKYELLSKIKDRRCIEIMVVSIDNEELREQAMSYLYDEASQINIITTLSDHKKMLYLIKGYSTLNKAIIIRSMKSHYNKAEALQYLVGEDKDFHLSSLLCDLPDNIKEMEIENLKDETYIASLLLSFTEIDRANKFFHLVKNPDLIVYMMRILYERYDDDTYEIECHIIEEQQVLHIRKK
ncbi:MAG: hypothetical protein R3Y54_03125 [Eubacteriales bacterium]